MAGSALTQVVVLGLLCGGARGAQNIAPTADGTLADGGPFGVFDGVADVVDWSFNESSFEGAITRTEPTEKSPGLEQRVVWEYAIPATFQPPLTATLLLRLRGAPRFPALPAEIQIVAYPADLLQTVSDFSAGPGTVVRTIAVAPYQTPTDYTVGVSAAVSEIMRGGATAVGFRFQVDPRTASPSSQAFIDALDSDPATKPVLSLDAAVPGDADGDKDVDAGDLGSFEACIGGPGATVSVACRKSDFDRNGAVDLRDVTAFWSFREFFRK